ncbi:MAG: 6-carboxytetrahydropterin synthase [Bacteroidetes bacterium]|nr:6-carboxytetrahydropterin synthase [Bacteroidota bacterium]
MISVTKIFRFEAAHAIYAYPGPCGHIHGHSYELHVTVSHRHYENKYLEGQGMIIDFKELKKRVMVNAIDMLDHKLILSDTFLSHSTQTFDTNQLVIFPVEPTAENMLIFLRDRISAVLPDEILLDSLKLWETRDSYATWTTDV